MSRKVIKRDGRTEKFDLDKVVTALEAAFKSQGYELPEAVQDSVISTLKARFKGEGDLHVEDIQDTIERCLMECREYDVARAYICYREKHKELRLIKDRVDYMEEYIHSDENAATSSEEDANANVSIKNMANLDGEVYKTLNRQIQRYRMRKKLEEECPEVAHQYEKDLEHHIIYTHDEASVPTVKNYCEAVTLYPMVSEGTRAMDGLGTEPPHCLSSFCGQFVNLTFLLAAQCKGAVAFGEFFNFLDYFCAKDFGEDYHLRTHELASEKPKRTILSTIHQAYQQIVYGVNQPAGNRSYQSPFTNISYYDKNYWHALFEDFYFPDGTQPKWERVDFLQRDFMNWFNKERTRALLTFPVETMALLSDGKDIIDQDYKDFTAEMYSKGHSFFTYISDNPNALASCCRLRNEIDENTFSFTNGLTGVQTGSANVITLNLNRIIQDYFDEIGFDREEAIKAWANPETETQEDFKQYFVDILDRVYKYHHAYKDLLYEVEKKGMLNASTAGYIKMNKLYCTIGLNGINEMANFLGIECNDTDEYKNLCRLVTGTISEQNKLHREGLNYQYNTEFVPGESLSSKNYKWDKADGYWVPEDRNLYNSYFFLQSDETKSVLDKMRMHGRDYTELLDGGVGCHINLEDHLSKKQYSMLIDYAIKVGCNYFTYNIINSECKDCGYITKVPIDTCPKCGSHSISMWSRIIGYLRPLENFEKERYKEALTRHYNTKDQVE